ncbi:MAG TPA: hypothetical protein PKC96_06620 [Bacilli bacterium]|nr:hypothetical protein [Bacilli bacterium]
MALFGKSRSIDEAYDVAKEEMLEHANRNANFLVKNLVVNGYQTSINNYQLWRK